MRKTAGLIVLLSILFCFCTSNASDKTKAGTNAKSDDAQKETFQYDLAKPAANWTLPAELKEVSGNSYIDATHFLLIEDLHPILYLMRLEKDKAVIEKQIPFAEVSDKKFDIEDIAVSGNTAYALWSHGVVYKIDNWKGQSQVKELNTDLDKKNNTEGLCVDPVSGNLLIACKNEAGMDDEKKSDGAIYDFDLSKGKLNSDPFLVIEKKEFAKVADEELKFYPSTVAVHPGTHDVYVLSTKTSKGMVVYTHDGKIKSYQPINANIMPQPEGICFSPDGNSLYISTEGRHGEPAKLYQFNKK